MILLGGKLAIRQCPELENLIRHASRGVFAPKSQ